MSGISSPDFIDKQLRFPRLAQAYAAKGEIVENLLQSYGIRSTSFDLFLRALKKERKLEVWAKNTDESTFVLIKSYSFTGYSGLPGPKRRSGDFQIPEGFYQITNFNPESKYHLSLRISYPNQSDLFFADKEQPGNDIYIHGNAVTTGCIPIGDDNMEELYLIAAKAKNGGKPIHVHIFPTRLTGQDYKDLLTEYAADSPLQAFWSNLKPVYDAFEQNNILPRIFVDNRGMYRLKAGSPA